MASCTWPVYRNGHEASCGRSGDDSRFAPRCWQHQDKRSARERMADPIGPYVAAVERIGAKIARDLRAKNARLDMSINGPIYDD